MAANQGGFEGAPAPLNIGHGPTAFMNYFQQYRNEKMSRMQVPTYDWGSMDISYTPHPDRSVAKSSSKYLKLPQSRFSMLDAGRQQEVDDFYGACQMHRDQYRDYTGELHPLDYFKTADYSFQCPTDPTSQYMKCPDYYVQYKQPTVLPNTLDRSLRTPSLPSRALTGVYNPGSDMVYKR